MLIKIVYAKYFHLYKKKIHSKLLNIRKLIVGHCKIEKLRWKFAYDTLKL